MDGGGETFWPSARQGKEEGEQAPLPSDQAGAVYRAELALG